MSNPLPQLLQASSRPVWMQAIGRVLYQAGYGAIQFYIPLIFVKQVGMSATTVGLGLGSGALAGIFGHLLGGYLADSPAWGRKQTLLISAGLSILAAIVLGLTHALLLMVIANLLLGLSAGCYWTAADASIIDVTSSEQREAAFAVMVLADSLGGGVGVLGGGILMALVPQPQTLFLLTSLLFLVFLGLVQFAVVETQENHPEPADTGQGFVAALRDRSLQLFVLVNILFTTYIALVNNTLPLYFTNVMAAGHATGTSLVSVANWFTWCYIGVGAVLQLPIVQLLNALARTRVLMLSLGLWSVGFLLVWVTSQVVLQPLIAMIAALSVLSIATATYKPFATAIVAELAPPSLRAVYLAISYQCWSIGYFVGPILGGWALDQAGEIADRAWIGAAASTVFGCIILVLLSRQQLAQQSVSADSMPLPSDDRPLTG